MNDPCTIALSTDQELMAIHNPVMYKLQLQYNNVGEWVDTVFPPCEYERANGLLNYHSDRWHGIHTYRLVEIDTAK